MMQRSLAQQLTMVFGVAFTLAGILGFIPGITTHYSDMNFAGHDSGAKLLGLFQVSILHNLVHLLFGIAAFALARTWETARTYLLGSGVIYVVLFLYGIFTSSGSSANFVPINGWDDALHALLAVGLLGSYFVSGGEGRVRDVDVGARA
jgi:ABC-type transport system involved in multi-copper enzyme maturation permease subunit